MPDPAPDARLVEGAGGRRPARGSLIVRVPSLDASALDAGLVRIVASRPAAVFLSEAVGAHDVQRLGAKLAVAEAEAEIEAGEIGIIASPAATAAGALALRTLPGCSARLRAIVWDPAPLAAALGIPPDSPTLDPVAAELVLVAAAARVPAIGVAGPGGPPDWAELRRRGFAGALLDRAADVAAARAVFG